MWQHPNWLTPETAWHIIGGAHLPALTLEYAEKNDWVETSFSHGLMEHQVMDAAVRKLSTSKVQFLTDRVETNGLATLLAAKSPVIAEWLTEKQTRYLMTHPNFFVRALFANNSGFGTRERLQSLTGIEAGKPVNTLKTRPGNTDGELPLLPGETDKLIRELFSEHTPNWELCLNLLTSPISVTVCVSAAKYLPPQWHTTAVRAFPELISAHKNVRNDTWDGWATEWIKAATNWKMGDGHDFPAASCLTAGTGSGYSVDTEKHDQVLTCPETRDKARLQVSWKGPDHVTHPLDIIKEKWPYLLDQQDTINSAIEFALTETKTSPSYVYRTWEKLSEHWSITQLLPALEQAENHPGFLSLLKGIVTWVDSGETNRVTGLKKWVPLRTWVEEDLEALETYLQAHWPQVPIEYLLALSEPDQPPLLIDEACAMWADN